jgi:hypothetical protein
VLSRRRCPHTGIVNYFSDADPLFPVGSVIEADVPARYHWRCYLGGAPAAGAAPNMRTAEERLIRRYRAVLRSGGEAATPVARTDDDLAALIAQMARPAIAAPLAGPGRQ